MSVLLNFLVFQAGWFATVLGAAHGAPWLGLAAVSVAVALHLRFTRRPGGEAWLLASAVLLGLVADSLLLATGWIAYPNGRWVPGLAPYWIVTLWALFATTLNVSMRWLHGRPWLALVFGAVGGPLSYLAGARLGAMTFNDAFPAIVALAVGWGLAMPLLMRLARRLDGTREQVLPAFVHEGWRRLDSHG